jgi:hypothetical protein
MKTCPRCGCAKKTDKGVYCQPCAVHIAGVKRNVITHHAREGSSKGGLRARYSRRHVKVTLPIVK